MYLGIDLGTSAVKALLVDDGQRVLAEASAPLEISRPRPMWSEQDPEEWWRATIAAIATLRVQNAAALSAVRGIGLAGQMHGAVLLDDGDHVLRPAILWNDGRSAAECAELERRVPRLRAVTGNRAMPGFTAPKLLWVAAHEPEIFRRVARVLLPKDYLRLRLCGERVSEMSDAAGTLWLDVARRVWSAEMLAATGLSEAGMPRLVEGSAPSGQLRHALADEWGMGSAVVVAGGGGDNAAGAVGAGIVHAGDGLLSLGTSGVYFVSTDRFDADADSGVHAFCHCLPARWHQMSVILSAASCLSWVTAVTGAGTEAALLNEIEATAMPAAAVFLPYLSGERTPHNDPDAKGVFMGLTHATTRADLGRAVLEGVAFALADGQDALRGAGTDIGSVAVIGGGARSRLWSEILATVLERPLSYHEGAALGPAFGAARLARLAVTGEEPMAVCTRPPVVSTAEPLAELQDHYRRRRSLFQRLYRDLQPRFVEL